jgi:3-oxoacyl-[acyl-carrier protein] reductase
MQINFNGKNILIIAANGGLGNALTNFLCEAGANLFLVSKNNEKLNTLKNELKITIDNQFIEVFSVDLLSRNSPLQVFNKLNELNFIPEIVIHNLGGTLAQKSFLVSQESIEDVLWLNALFAVNLNRLLIPNLKKKLSARIVHVSSISSKSLRGSGPYAASKAYLDAYTVCLGRELAKSSVVVSAIRPGAFLSGDGDWDRNLKERPDMVNDFLLHHHASARLGIAKEIAPIVLMLASDYFNWGQGSIINYDGGTM